MIALAKRSLRDPVLAVAVAIVSMVSIGAAAYFYSKGDTLAYKDAISHMQIARRVIHNPSGFSLAQLGGVWLPGPHVIMMPLIQNDWLYYSGLGGTVVSMVSYVLTCIFIYKIITDLLDAHSKSAARVGGVVGMLVFALNVNVLYMQSTPMTEMMLYAGLSGMVLAIQRWVSTERTGFIAWAALAAFFATMTRYEAWVLVVLLLVVIFVVMLVRRYNYKRMQDVLLLSGGSMLFGVIMWGWWNNTIFGDPLYFQRGEYADPALWVGKQEAAVGNWGIAFKTYFYAMAENVHVFAIGMAIISLIVVALMSRSLKPLPVLSMIGFIPFFIYSLYAGQRPLHVEQVHGSLYNVRFGLVVVLPVACLIGNFMGVVFDKLRTGTLVSPALARGEGRLPKLSSGYASLLVLGIVTVNLFTLLGGPAQVATWREPLADQATSYSQSAAEVSDFLAENYSGGLVLMESYGNELVLTDARIDFTSHVYEGSNKDALWQSSLSDPAANGIQVVVMRRSQDGNDLVYNTLSGTSQLNGKYTQVFANTYYEVWRPCQTGRCT